MSTPVADETTNPARESAQPADRLEVIEAEPAAASGPLAGDPSILGLAALLPGGTALGLALTGYMSLGGGIAVFALATGLFQLIACVWAARLGQSAVAAVFGVFASFWITFPFLLLGLTHSWFGLLETDATRVVPAYVICFLVAFGALTIGTLRLPLLFSVVFALVVLAFALVLAGTLAGSTALTTLGGYAVFAFTAVGVYLFINALALATGGAAMWLGKPLQS